MKLELQQHENYWDEFVTDAWEQKYQVMDSIIEPDVMTRQESFELMLNNLNNFMTRSGTGVTMRIFVDAKALTFSECEELGLVPELSDKSFEEYLTRIKPALNGREFCFLVDRSELTPKARDKVYGQLRSLYSRLGYIAPDSLVFFFFGDYRKTPFGAHNHDTLQESESSFIISLEGEKNIWLWPDGYEEKHPEIIGATAVDEHLPTATKLTAKPGQMLYFPSNFMHIGESEVKDSFNLFLAAKSNNEIIRAFIGYFSYYANDYVAVNELKDKLSILRALAERHEKKHDTIKLKDRENTRLAFDVNNMQLCANKLPQEIIDAAKSLASYLPKDLVDLMSVKFWLSVLTSFGLVSRSNLYPKPALLSSQTIQTLDNHPLLWAMAGDKMVISTAGHTWEYVDKPFKAIASMIEALHKGERINVEVLVGAASLHLSEQERETFHYSDFIEILDQLNSIGVFRISD